MSTTEIGAPIFPRFFLVTTQSGVKSLTLSLDGAREWIYGPGHFVVECVAAVWTYKCYHQWLHCDYGNGTRRHPLACALPTFVSSSKWLTNLSHYRLLKPSSNLILRFRRFVLALSSSLSQRDYLFVLMWYRRQVNENRSQCILEHWVKTLSNDMLRSQYPGTLRRHQWTPTCFHWSQRTRTWYGTYSDTYSWTNNW